MREGLGRAVEVPFRTAELSLEVLDVALSALISGKRAAASDALVGAQMAFSGVVGGTANVKINLADVHDRAHAAEMLERCQALLAEAENKKNEVMKIFEEKIR